MKKMILVSLAAIFKSVADTSADHYDISIFSNLDSSFWDKKVAAEVIDFLPLTNYRPDAWHIANSMMIGCFIAAIFIREGVPDFTGRDKLNRIMWGFQACIIYILVFNLFYNVILV